MRAPKEQAENVIIITRFVLISRYILSLKTDKNTRDPENIYRGMSVATRLYMYKMVSYQQINLDFHQNKYLIFGIFDFQTNLISALDIYEDDEAELLLCYNRESTSLNLATI